MYNMLKTNLDFSKSQSLHTNMQTVVAAEKNPSEIGLKHAGDTQRLRSFFNGSIKPVLFLKQTMFFTNLT